MKMACLLFSAITALSLALVTPATADSTLYENGSFGPDADGWAVSNGFMVGDTFTLTT